MTTQAAVTVDPVDQCVVELIERAKNRGYLTWEEMNETLPDEAVAPDKLETIMLRLAESGIEMIDEAEADRLGCNAKDKPGKAAKPRKKRRPAKKPPLRAAE